MARACNHAGCGNVCFVLVAFGNTSLDQNAVLNEALLLVCHFCLKCYRKGCHVFVHIQWSLPHQVFFLYASLYYIDYIVVLPYGNNLIRTCFLSKLKACVQLHEYYIMFNLGGFPGYTIRVCFTWTNRETACFFDKHTTILCLWRCAAKTMHYVVGLHNR